MTSKSFRFRTADEALSFEGETMSVSNGYRRVGSRSRCFVCEATDGESYEPVSG